ncbi:MAG: hypothetical protein LBP87_05710, partial [Planctomycetaceae bacterium]|nr:hypothetical protein [Planctomycetaceae bacterium]
WQRFHFDNITEAQNQSDLYVNAINEKIKKDIDDTKRRDFEEQLINNTKNKKDTNKNNTIIFIKRTNDNGQVKMMGHLWQLDENWTLPLIRATVDLKNHVSHFHKLTRKEPHNHLYIASAEYHLPIRKNKKK